MKKHFRIIALFLVFSNVIIAQTEISGRLLDSNQSPIQFANIVLLDADQHKILTGTTSDTLGFFQLDHSQTGNFIIKISYVGFKDYTKSINSSAKLGEIVLIPNQSLDEIVLTSKGIIRLEKKKGVFIVNLENTTFNNSDNVWEGLKQVPMLQVVDEGVKVNNKFAILEINGVEILLSGEELRNYLESLSPNALKNIEINSNPNASYGSEVDAVIRLNLKNQLNNYRIGLKSSNGYRSNYFNNENINFSLGAKKLRIYTNYSFKYLPKVNTSEIKQRILNRETNLEYTENNEIKSHSLLLNVAYDLSKKDVIHLNQIFYTDGTDVRGNSLSTNFTKDIDINSNTKTIQLTQEWMHSFNDSTYLKIGFYEILKNYETLNFSTTNDLNGPRQEIKSRLPLFIGFLDYTFSSEQAETSIGLKYNRNKVRNDNINITDLESFNSPFEYDEKLASLYVNHSIYLSDEKSLDLGIRTESTFVDYTFSNSSINKVITNKREYSNVLFNVNYNWISEKEWYKNVSLRKQITRPNYSYLNPFKTIESDVVLFKGDLDIVPDKHLSLSYQLSNEYWSFFSQLGIFSDYISTINELEDTLVTETYRNFDRVYYTSIGVQHTKAFFEGSWRTSNGLNFNYFKLDDSDYKELKKSTPIVYFQSYHNINLAENLHLSLNYVLEPSFHDGLIRHFKSQKFDLHLSKKINQFKIIFFIKDLFQTNYSSYEISNSDFLYSSNYYDDVQSFGISLRWSIKGKAYTSNNISTPGDDAIDRLENR